MKRASKILSLLLIGVMVLTLLPSAAFADPPKGDTHLHSWSVIARTQATCTTEGSTTWRCSACGETYTETYKALGHAPTAIAAKAPTCTGTGLTEGSRCSRCGVVLKAQETVPALGHDWDGGTVTTEPRLLTPGVRTFTCKRDHSHTRTEEIDPLPFVFASLSGASFDFSSFTTFNFPPLVITEQPAGGSITRWEDETHTMHVAASGGVGEYTYEWHSASQDYGKEEDANAAIKWLFGLLGVTPEEIDAILETSFSNTDTCTVSIADQEYYCVVTDEAGQSITSDKAPLRYKIRIAKHPDNANLQPTGTATLFCEAADGSGSYSYRWIDNHDNEIGTGSTISVNEIGDYMCLATDDVTGETVDSYACTVYDAEPFRLMTFTGDGEYTPDSSGILVAGFAGGVEPYEIWWDKDGEAIESVDAEVEGYIGSVVHNATIGNYTVHAVDAMGEVITATSHRIAPKLTIVEQPVGGTIPKNGFTDFSVSVADGEAPYKFVLYRNGEYEVEVTTDSTKADFRAWYTGNYYIHIEDSKGRSADSNVVMFEDAVFRIKDQTKSASLAKPGDTASLFVEAEGGLEPYTYLWSYKRYNTRYKVGEARTHSADKPGEYLCRVVDVNGDMIYSATIQVGYTGDVPFITKQPEGGVMKDGSFYISCDAVSGSGGELSFVWEKSTVPNGTRPNWGNATRSGSSSRGIDATAPGAYRCKVTDTKTGKYTYTQLAMVAGELAATAEVGMIRNWGRVGDVEAHIKITGGMAPYKVKIYVEAMVWTEDGRTNGRRTILYRTYTVNTPKEAEDVYCSYTPYQEIHIFENGEWKRYTDYYIGVYAEITDAEGDSVTVNLE